MEPRCGHLMETRDRGNQALGVLTLWNNMATLTSINVNTCTLLRPTFVKRHRHIQPERLTTKN